MIQLRQCYHDDMRRFYESCINGQKDDVETMETVKTLYSDRMHDCAIYLRLMELIAWGRINNLHIDDLDTHRVECYHDDDYWKRGMMMITGKECCHGEYE